MPEITLRDRGYYPGLHWFIVFTATCTLLLVIAGGLVTSTGSGLAVPDWPLSYGQLMPPMVGGIFFEHGHRMIATFVGFLTVVMTVWTWKREQRKWVRILAAIALGAVILQGVLGGLTVIFLLPASISVAHATLAQTFFALVSSLALFTSNWWHEDHPLFVETEARPSMSFLIFSLIGVLYVQLILGGLMRHTESGLAIPDFPLSYGQLVPSLSSQALDDYNTFLFRNDYRIAAEGPITTGQVLVHFAHRAWALVVTIVMGWVSFRLFKLGRTFPHFRFFSMALPSILLLQIALGASTVLFRKEFIVTTAHVATGASLLVLSFLLCIHVFRYRQFRWEPQSQGIHDVKEVVA